MSTSTAQYSSRVEYPTRHTIGYFGEDHPSQSLDWCKSLL